MQRVKERRPGSRRASPGPRRPPLRSVPAAPDFFRVSARGAGRHAVRGGRHAAKAASPWVMRCGWLAPLRRRARRCGRSSTLLPKLPATCVDRRGPRTGHAAAAFGHGASPGRRSATEGLPAAHRDQRLDRHVAPRETESRAPTRGPRRVARARPGPELRASCARQECVSCSASLRRSVRAAAAAELRHGPRGDRRAARDDNRAVKARSTAAASAASRAGRCGTEPLARAGRPLHRALPCQRRERAPRIDARGRLGEKRWQLLPHRPGPSEGYPRFAAGALVGRPSRVARGDPVGRRAHGAPRVPRRAIVLSYLVTRKARVADVGACASTSRRAHREDPLLRFCPDTIRAVGEELGLPVYTGSIGHRNEGEHMSRSIERAFEVPVRSSGSGR